MNKKEVMEALGAEVDSYESCNFDINRNFLFAGDWMRPFHLLVPDILAEIPVLICKYTSGDRRSVPLDSLPLS